jgi:hypothetical protein
MLIRILGVIVALLGLALMVLAVVAWGELHSAATSQSAPAADSLPLTRLVNPELFDAGKAGATPAKPVELVQAAFQRIYLLGGGSIALILIGTLMLVMPQRPNSEGSASD